MWIPSRPGEENRLRSLHGPRGEGGIWRRFTSLFRRFSVIFSWLSRVAGRVAPFVVLEAGDDRVLSLRWNALPEVSGGLIDREGMA